MAGPRLQFPAMFLRSVTFVLSVYLLLAQISLAQNSSAEELTGFSFAAHQFDKSNLTLLGNAYVGYGLANNGSNTLLLTASTPNATGKALYSQRVRVLDAITKNALQFSVNFSFSAVKQLAEHSGEGIAFIMSPDNVTTGLDAGYLGWLNNAMQGNSSGRNFAVEFDTGNTSWCDDPDDNHVGINVNSLKSLVTMGAGKYTNSTVNPFVEIDLSVDNPLYAWIDYNYYLLNVTISRSPDKPEKPLISYRIDLSEYLDEFMFVGFTGSTEDYDNRTTNVTNEVYDWSFQTGADASRVPPGFVFKHGLSKSTIAISVAVSVSISLLVTLLALRYFRYYRKGREQKRVIGQATELFRTMELPEYYGAHKIQYEELSAATGNFSEKGKLGKGGFGIVYRGVLPSNNVVVAVKRISRTSQQGVREFLAEVKIVGRMSHRNLVPLLGWCHNKKKGELLLVYEYMSNGSLDQLIFKEGVSKVVLSWEQRAKIVLGIATALHFLHEEYEHRVLHRDVKASNVMLDADWNARLSDFGLARLYDHSEGPQTTKFVAGTPGYMAPDLLECGRATEKTDVYSFGALVLEIATGRRAAVPIKDGSKCSLVEWVWSLSSLGTVLDAADLSLGEEYDKKNVELFLQMGVLCCLPDPEQRPTMREVLRYLNLEVPFSADLVPPFTPRSSFALGRGYISVSKVLSVTLDIKTRNGMSEGQANSAAAILAGS